MQSTLEPVDVVPTPDVETPILYKGIFSRLSDLLFNPKQTFEAIDRENAPTSNVIYPYYIVIAAFMALASGLRVAMALSLTGLLPALMTGHLLAVGSFTASFFGIFLKTVLQSFVLALLWLFIGAALLTFFSPYFGGKRAWGKSLRVLVYSPAPFVAMSFVGCVPFVGSLLGFLVTPLAVVWGLYLFYIAIRTLLKTSVPGTVRLIISFSLAMLILSVLSTYALAKRSPIPQLARLDYPEERQSVKNDIAFNQGYPEFTPDDLKRELARLRSGEMSTEESERFLNRLQTDPALSKYYQSLLEDAAKQPNP